VLDLIQIQLVIVNLYAIQKQMTGCQF